MGSDVYYKIWLRNAANSAWVELDTFTGEVHGDSLNGISYFRATAYSTDSATQALFTAGRHFRITDDTSTDGTVATLHNGQSSGEGGAGFEIITGTLSEPRGDWKGAVVNSLPVEWQVEGFGLVEKTRRLVYDNESLESGSGAAVIEQLLYHATKAKTTTLTGTATATNGSTSVTGAGTAFTTELKVGHILQFDSETKGYVVASITNDTTLALTRNYTGTTGGGKTVKRGDAVLAGTIDTGPPSISVQARKADLYQFLVDVASIGDAATEFTYYIDVTQTSVSDFTPKVHYLSSTNALYETANPFSPTDNGRIVDESAEAQEFDIIDEKDRIWNGVKVRYTGIGSAAASTTETAEATNSASITSFGLRATIVYAPFIQDNATALILRNTILNTFKGNGTPVATKSGTTGLPRSEAILNTGDLFASAFDAILGDQVGLKNSAGSEVVQGKFIAYAYEQSTTNLRVVIGMPRVPVVEQIAPAMEAKEKNDRRGSAMGESGWARDATNSIVRLTNQGDTVVIGNNTASGATAYTSIAANSLKFSTTVGETAQFDVQPDGALDIGLRLTTTALERRFFPATDNAYHLGTSTNRWSVVNAVTLSATTLSATDLTLSGNLVVNGNTTLGNATSDTITATARFTSDLVPSNSNTRDIGLNGGPKWKDIWIDGGINATGTSSLGTTDFSGTSYALNSTRNGTVDFGATGFVWRHLFLGNSAAASSANTSDIQFELKTSVAQKAAVILKSSFSTTTDASRVGKLEFQIANSGNPTTIMYLQGNTLFYNAHAGFEVRFTGGDANIYNDTTNGKIYILAETGGSVRLGTNGVNDRLVVESNSNVGINGQSYGGAAEGVVFIGNRAIAPSADPVGGGVLYAEGGALKWRGSGGTTTTIAVA